ncbi:type II-A CRISPR-associated protein Csn2 [Pelagirhabdus alkalitolerans]|nr:type II-A CRISPR-associated protein Csn2 [Pelagirhabdus alkalitolerans]
MKLNFPILEQSIKIERPTVLVLEEVQTFANMVKSFYDYENCNLKIFDEKYKPIKASEILVITDIISFELNSTTVLKHIYTDLEEYLNDNPSIKTAIEQVMMSLNDIISNEILDHELDLQTSDMTLQSLFKSLNLKINSNSESINEKITDIIQVFKYLSKKKLLVFVNVCSYLTKEEIQETIRYLSLNDITSILIEPRVVKGATQYILDKDYFLTYGNVL